MLEKLIADIDKRLDEKIHSYCLYSRDYLLAAYREASRQALIAVLEEQYQAPEPLKRPGNTLYTAMIPDSGRRRYTANPEASPTFDWKPL